MPSPPRRTRAGLHRTAAAVAAALLLVPAPGVPAPARRSGDPSADPPPNVLLLTIDTLRADRMSSS
jgi:hypothetical protein